MPILGVLVSDQFGSALYDLKKITHLCAPVNKNNEDPTAPQHPGHLVCYVAKLSRTCAAVRLLFRLYVLFTVGGTLLA